MKQWFRFQSFMRFLALVVAGLVANTATAHADTMYSFTLTPTIKAGEGSVGGTVL